MKEQDHPSDSELLQSMLAGDEQALIALYQRRQRCIYQFALQMCGSPALAEDVTQEVFMVLIREGKTFDPGRGSLTAFLIGVARNHVLRRLRRERFYVALGEDSETAEQASATSQGPLDDLSRTETIESVRRSVLALPERYREVVVLCDLQELSYAEAAEVLGCAVGTVRSRLHRGRAMLIEKLRPAPEAEETAAANPKSARCFA
ncbi:MAG TPA: RNA polymerase sigma factor [Pyrinomonadaceae bacterium]|jgi:RNA polymerase sigma-70 factor (ECF subfamily)|nr:RNA polymerase sigma factor [Pyrinomonadaceae bacterium]